MRRFLLLVFGTFFLANLVAWLCFGLILDRLTVSLAVHRTADTFFLLQIIGIASFGISRGFFRLQPGTGLGRPLLSLLMIWNLLFAVPAAVIFLAWSVVWRLTSGPAAGVIPDSMGRTIALVACAIPFAFTLLATAISQWQLRRFRIRRVTLSLPNLPPALKGLSIVHLSDFHIGKLTRGQVLEDIVAATNQLDADLILLTGDLINMAMEDLPGALALLRRLKSRYGLFSCEGNHDLIESRDKFEADVKSSGLNFLLNEAATISVRNVPVQILGLRWGEGMAQARETPGAVPQDALSRLLSRRDPRDFVILLAHHPDAFAAAVRAGIPLTLAGHTHGGQLMLTPRIGFGPWVFRYWSGVYAQASSRLVVSNGVGNWFPWRVHAPAEIIHLTLE